MWYSLGMSKKTIGNANTKWTPEIIQEEALKYEGKLAFFRGNGSAYNAAKKLGVFDQVCSHMTSKIVKGAGHPKFKWDAESIRKEALKYTSRGDFTHRCVGAFQAAVKLGIYDEVTSHMPNLKHNWTKEEILEKALQYSSKVDFVKNDTNAHSAAKRMGIFEEVCAHMTRPDTKLYNEEELQSEALKYSDRVEFMRKNSGMYQAAYKRGLLDKICEHMGETATSAWDVEDLKREALKYNMRSEFQMLGSGPYQAAKKRGILDDICGHMKSTSIVSSKEEYLFETIKKVYPTTQKRRDRDANIEGKPYIKGFDIDIYIPELNKGIEFDGKYWHSFQKMRSSNAKSQWSDDDIRNYHNLKDEHFRSKGITLIHIDENSWNKNKEECIEKCFRFLENK